MATTCLSYPDGKGDVISFGVGNAVALEKYDILKMSGAYSVAKASASGDIIAGLAATEKVASDGSTTIGAITSGVFDLFVGGAVAIGDDLVFSGAHALGQQLRKYTTLDDEKGAVIGKALETCSATAEDTIAVKLTL
jgi:hypothetical protein